MRGWTALEVWFLDPTGHPVTVWVPSAEPAPSRHGQLSPSSVTTHRGSLFVGAARACAIDWKMHTVALPEEARTDGVYGTGFALPFCLPKDAARLNLLPDAREVAFSRFAAANIRWHNAIDEGPSNHLLDSQIQCLNALAPFVAKPDALSTMFGSVLPISKVLPFGATTSSSYDASDHVVFEWPGQSNYLGEWSGPTPTRGAYSTSVDAAIRYESHDGAVEVALIEWKYTERYAGGVLGGGESKMQIRHDRYLAGFEDPEGPDQI